MAPITKPTLLEDEESEYDDEEEEEEEEEEEPTIQGPSAVSRLPTINKRERALKK